MTVVQETKPRGRSKKKGQDLAPITQQGSAPSETQQLIALLREAARDPKTDINKMQWLLDTRRQLLAEEAEQAFNDAMAAAQSEMRPIAKDMDNEQTASKYASYVALDRALRPIYTRHGFGLSFDTDDHPETNKIWVLCYVTHGRHKRTYKIPVPADGVGPKGGAVMTRVHALGSAATYGRRYLLLLIFNIATGKGVADDDGNAAGTIVANQFPPISPSQLKDLKALMKKAGISEEIVTEKFEVRELKDLDANQYTEAVVRCNRCLQEAAR